MAYVQFVPFTGQLLESAEEFNLTVLLDGEISLPVSVTILNSTGKLLISYQILKCVMYFFGLQSTIMTFNY